MTSARPNGEINVGFLSFLKSKPEAGAAPAEQAADAAPSADATAVLLTRTEIVDKRQRLAGYRFGADAPAPVLIEALVVAQVPEFAQERMALVPLSAEAVAAGLHLPLAAPHTLFLLDRDAAEAAAVLRAAGSQVALRGVSLNENDADVAALSAAQLVVLSLDQHPLSEFQALCRHLHLHYPHLKLLVDGVATWDEQRMLLSWGASYFMGPFLTTADQADPDAKIDQSRMTSIELLNLLRTDAELPAMIEVAKRDPGMTFQVLQWANAPANGQTTKVTSLQQAFMVLGRNQLYRGLTVSMFRLGGGANRERDASLLEIALTRARFLETCSQLPAASRDELFLVGLLSLFDVLLGVPMDKLVGKMHLSDDIRAVLLGEAGVYRPYLTMVLLLQRDKIAPALDIAGELGIDIDSLPAVGQAAFEWAQASLKYTSAD
ncbi:HDOD domain-containing protein [Duganella sp. FT94W]|uniref:HDOD domain-containing protein n=1 Tax=Duganella lactea TaxID=2692173 RepID=A0ABW9VCJ0_9BURK|nr:HDOD domain-containing protein [Duganella lactea]MYM36555.1 HDOD domain-containing protein [Duganella lactea]